MIILLINCYVFVAVLVSRGPVIVLCPLKGHTYLSKPIAFSIKMVETEKLSAAFFCTNKYLQLLGRALQSCFFSALEIGFTISCVILKISQIYYF